MHFKHIPTDKVYTPREVREKFAQFKKKDRTEYIFFAADPATWDADLLTKLKLERV